VTGNMLLATIPARELKRAKIKLALLGAVAQRVEEKPLDSISVCELCDSVQISETTFYNHFSKKSEVIAYCSKLWNLEITIRASQIANGRQGLVMIGELFEQIGHHIRVRPGLTGEVIAYIAKRRDVSVAPLLTLAEKLLAFPEFSERDEFKEDSIEEVLRNNLEWAVVNKELPSHTNTDAVAIALISMFYGIPLALRTTQHLAISSSCRRQLNILWLGVHGLASNGKKPPSNRPSLHHRQV